MANTGNRSPEEERYIAQITRVAFWLLIVCLAIPGLAAAVAVAWMLLRLAGVVG